MPDKRQGPEIAVEDRQGYKRAMEIFDNYYKYYNDDNYSEDRISELRGRLDEVYKGIGAPQIKVHTNKEEHEGHMGNDPYYEWTANEINIPLWSVEEAMNKSFIHEGLDPEEYGGLIGQLVQVHGAKSAYDNMLAEFGHAVQFNDLNYEEGTAMHDKAYDEKASAKSSRELYDEYGSLEHEAHTDIEGSLKKYLEF